MLVTHIGMCQYICGLLDMNFTKITHFSYAVLANFIYDVNYQLTTPLVSGSYTRGYKHIVANF